MRSSLGNWLKNSTLPLSSRWSGYAQQWSRVMDEPSLTDGSSTSAPSICRWNRAAGVICNLLINSLVSIVGEL